MKAGQFLFLLRRFDEFDPKINVQTNAKKTSYLSAINMDCTEAIVNNRSVKTVRKLQVLLHDEIKRKLRVPIWKINFLLYIFAAFRIALV